MLFPWFKRKKSASVAKERLKIAIMSDRTGSSDYPFMEDLKQDIIDVIKKYKKVSKVEVKKASGRDVNSLSIDIELE